MKFIFIIFPVYFALRIIFSSPTQVSCGQLFINPKNIAMQKSIASCFSNVVHQYFSRGSIICVVTEGTPIKTTFETHKSTLELIMADVMSNLGHNVMFKTLHKPAANFLIFEKVHNYMVMTESAEGCAAIVNMLEKKPSWNPHGNFLIYLFGIKADWRAIVTKIFSHLRKHLVINVTILVQDDSANWSPFITYMPYDAGNCGKQDIQFVQIGTCRNGTIQPLRGNLFPVKVPRLLNNCPIRVATTKIRPFVLQLHNVDSPNDNGQLLDEGIEIKLLKTIAREMQFTIQFVNHRDDSYKGNVMIAKLKRRQVEVAVGRIVPNEDFHRQFDFSFQYTNDDLIWIVPNSNVLPFWVAMGKIFNQHVWVATIFCYLLVTGFIRFIGKLVPHEHSAYKQIVWIALNTYGMMTGTGPSRSPRAVAARLLIFIWAMFSFYWISSFTTILISMITTPRYLKNINNLDDIFDNKMSIGLNNVSLAFFSRERSIVTEQILKRYVPCPNMTICLHLVTNNKNFVAGVSREFYNYVQYHFKDSSGQHATRALKQAIASPPIEMLMQKGFPLLPRINELMRRLMESGLIRLWSEAILPCKYGLGVETGGAVALNMTNLGGAFYVLITGLFLSFCCFILEIITFRIKKARARA